MKLAENFPNIVEISKLAELKQELKDKYSSFLSNQ